MDTAHWPQVDSDGVGVKQMELVHGHGSSTTSKGLLERKARPLKDQALNCPRCNSTNTKFCYYNNYSLSQPRYFCKACRRYWTEGGSLRNVPVGGGSRKNKKLSSSSSLDKKITDPKIHHAQDLNLAFFPSNDQDLYNHQNPNSSSSSSSSSSAMELLKSGMAMTSRGLTPFMTMPAPVSHSSNNNTTSLYNNTSGFPNLHEFKPSLNFSLEGFESGYGSLHQEEETERNTNGQQQLMFPIQDLKQVSNSAAEFEQNRGHGGDHSGGYWNGMLGGGSW